MVLAVFLAAMAGVFAVVQAGLNKVIADDIGFTASLVLNGIFFLLFNVLLFVLVVWQPKMLPPEFAVRWSAPNVAWWWVLPGIFGFCLVAGMAVSLFRIGATQTFVVSIAAQIIASIGWDVIMGGPQLSALRILGAVITLAGAILAIGA